MMLPVQHACRLDSAMPGPDGVYFAKFVAMVAGEYTLQLVVNGQAVPQTAAGSNSLVIQVRNCSCFCRAQLAEAEGVPVWCTIDTGCKLCHQRAYAG